MFETCPFLFLFINEISHFHSSLGRSINDNDVNRSKINTILLVKITLYDLYFILQIIKDICYIN